MKTNDQLSHSQLKRFEDWMNSVESISELINDSLEEIDFNRCLPKKVLDALHDAKIFRMSLPKKLGGGEFTPELLSQAAERLARADASVGWCFGQGTGCAMSAAFLEDGIAEDIFGPGDSVLAWGAGQAGKAVACDGGYKVTGTWRFASGAGHATWLGGHSMVFEEDGSPRINKDGKHVDRTALFKKKSATMKDDWHVMGLKGTRSESYTVEDMFIPESHTLDREAPEECRIQAPLYIFPTTLVYASCFSGVALGIARGSLDDLILLARTKVQRAARSSMRESPVFQTQLAELEAKWGAAKAYQQATLIEITDRVKDTMLLSMSDRAKIRLATTYAINEATEVVQKVYRLAGSTAIFENQPFERRFRDMHAVSQQMQARYTHFETVGRHMMDLDNTAAHM